MRTRPAIFFSLRNHTCHNRIVLDIDGNALPLLLVSDPVVIRFPLPKRLTGSPQQPVGLVRGIALERLQQPARGNLRQQQDVHMVCHDRKGTELVMTQLNAAQ